MSKLEIEKLSRGVSQLLLSMIVATCMAFHSRSFLGPRVINCCEERCELSFCLFHVSASSPMGIGAEEDEDEPEPPEPFEYVDED